MEDALEPTMEMRDIASLGGKTAAANMTPEQRRERARQAAMSRWGKDIEVAPYNGVIKIASPDPKGQPLELPCSVLADGTRVLHERGVMKALGVTRSGGAAKTAKTVGGAKLPLFVAQSQIIPFLDQDLNEVLQKPLWYKPPSGKNSGRPHKGVRAELLPKICNVWLRARDAGVLRAKSHLLVAFNADIINRGLAVVGITALVDEATGFQDLRAKDALAKILEQFVAKELQPYLSGFPVDFFRELCRLRNVPFRSDMRRPRYFGRLINNLVYCRLAPGVLEELNRKNPADDNGRRKGKNYKWLTPTTGHPKLQLLLGSEVTLMRMSKDFESFKALVDEYHKPFKPLPLFDWAAEHKDDAN